MLHDSLAQNLYSEICHIPLIDPHTHIDPNRPTSRSLDDILGYHYYTELAHSTGMPKELTTSPLSPRERTRAIFRQMSSFDNTVQYHWFVEIARAFLGFQGERLTVADCDVLSASAEKVMAQPDWEHKVLRRSNILKVFLTNDFDDPLQGFDTGRYIPCLRTDDLVFHLDQPEVRQRWTKATGCDLGSAAALRNGLVKLFEHFTQHGAKACAISLPPVFAPLPLSDEELTASLVRLAKGADAETPEERAVRSHGLFWLISEQCEAFALPFDLMSGVSRRVYEHGVHQGQDLFDQRTSLSQYRRLFNAFPKVTFCVSVLSSGQNQELASYAWIFPNVVTSGHWWYSNIPTLIQQDARLRLQAVPKTKQIGYYSDMYKLEFGLPKFNMYRRILAQILADDFVRPRIYSESQALDLAYLLLYDNPRKIFRV